MGTNDVMSPDDDRASGSCDAHAVVDRSADWCTRASDPPAAESAGGDRGTLAIELREDESSRSVLGHRPVTAGERARILSLHHAERWPVGTIGAQLGRHHDTVK